jgi:hypothetical protein
MLIINNDHQLLAPPSFLMSILEHRGGGGGSIEPTQFAVPQQLTIFRKLIGLHLVFLFA